MICEIPYDLAKDFVKDKNLILKDEYKYYGLFSPELKSIIGVKEGEKVKLHCNYTLPNERKKGYFSRLLDYVIYKYPCKIIADCLEDSKNIYTKKGFVCCDTKVYKNFTIYKMQKGG